MLVYNRFWFKNTSMKKRLPLVFFKTLRAFAQSGSGRDVKRIRVFVAVTAIAAQFVGVDPATANPRESDRAIDNAVLAGRRESPSMSQADGDGSSRFGGGPVAAMTFNVRYPAGNDTNQLSWAVRKDLVVEIVKKYKPDFLGTQEIVAEYLPFLEKELSDYPHIGRFRKGDGDRFDECSKIFYRKDRWEVVEGDTGSFQLSETPEVVGSRDWTSMARVTSWGRFREIATGRTLYVYNTHWDHRTGRDESSILCAERIAARKVPDDPVIFMGDFNRRQNTNPIRHLMGERVYDKLPPIAMIDTDPEVEKIDHIFVWPHTVRVIEAGVVKERFEVDSYKNVRPSDHDPTRAVFEMWTQDYRE